MMFSPDNQKVVLDNVEDFKLLMETIRGERRTVTNNNGITYSADYQGFGKKSKELFPYIDLETYLDREVHGSSCYNYVMSDAGDMADWFRLLDLTDLDINIPLELWPIQDLWDLMPYVWWLFRVENHRSNTNGNEEWYLKNFKQMAENPYCAELLRRGVDRTTILLRGENLHSFTTRENSYRFMNTLKEDLPELLGVEMLLRHGEILAIWDGDREDMEDELDFEGAKGAHFYDELGLPTNISSFFPVSIDMFRKQEIITQKDF